jgi:protein-ribulosamine 3-kinase
VRPDGAVAQQVAGALDTGILRRQPLGGGCVSPAYRVDLEDGRIVFVKTAPPGAPPDLLAQEALGLSRLRQAGAVRVPEVIAAGADWLVLEWLEPARATAAAWTELGRSLARQHRCSAAEYGWESDNYIGSLPQRNQASSSWAEFWAQHRLRPQLALAESAFDAATLRSFDVLLADLDERLADVEADGPSLLHGDLWNGNVHVTAAGPALIDPSCSYGHREVDLAMADLFGGFPPGFFRAYADEWPLQPGAALRRPVYQLYYLLVHVNLFGGGYVGATVRALHAALADA